MAIDPNAYDASQSIQQIARDGYKAVAQVEVLRGAIMSDVKAASATSAASRVVGIAGVSVDISTGAGALVLDDYLQELSTVEQAAAQLVAAENKAQKQVHSVTGQG